MVDPRWVKLAIAGLLGQLVAAQSASETVTSATASSSLNTASSISSAASSTLAQVSTAVPSPTAAANSTVESLPLPPVQAWCDGGANSTYCPGAILQLVQLSGVYSDSKTFPDKPTLYNASVTNEAFAALPQNATVGDVEQFVETYFRGEGLEISQAPIENFTATPAILANVEDDLYHGFVSIVNGYWSLLVRETNQSALCQDGECESSLIPLNRTFIVPGGRYREIYYWDSFWILQGLLKSELYLYSYNLLENFMDLIEMYGFLPNGGRKYYLNRSQPPVFVQMVDAYVQVTGNVSILDRALPILESELQWWRQNRTISVKSPYTNKTHSVARYAVNNTAPRPEGYQEDIATVFGAEPALNETERGELFAELATGAESGWDYSGGRWCKEPVINLTDNNPSLRTLNIRQQIPVDLNALLYGDHVLLANLYELHQNASSSRNSGNSTGGRNSTGSSLSGSNSNVTGKIQSHRMIAKEFEAAILDLFYDKEKLWFYDFNMTANARASTWHPGGLFPLWQNITPSEVVGNDTAALGMFAGIRYLIDKYPGPPVPATLYQTGLNWDGPNVWPPHVHVGLKALEAIGRVNSNASTLQNVSLSDFAQIPSGQLGFNESGLPPQDPSLLGNNSIQFEARVSEMQRGKPWPLAIAIEIANRYMQVAFCSWYSTGGSIPGVLEQLSMQELNMTGQAVPGESGNIFEKFNLTDVDAAGGGGEYKVQIGFGWSNGVILYTAGEYGQYLVQPSCPLIAVNEETNATSTQNATSAVKLFSGYRIPRQ